MGAEPLNYTTSLSFLSHPPGQNGRKDFMPSYYDNKTKNWYCIFYYTDWTGTRKQKKKRGFERKKDAQEWERDFLQRQAAQPDMPFSTLSELYLKDKEQNTKFATYRVHKMRVDTWLLPVFGNRPINAIMPVDVRNWQGYLKTAISAQNKPLSDGYRHDLFVELSGVFNFAMRFYGLSVNPCKVVGNTPVKHKKKLNFWTKEEFDRFLSTFDAADPFRMAYLTLYYTGMRIGELQALTASDVDTEAGTITISKTYHRKYGVEMITTPKTPKANRTITIPKFLCAALQEYINKIYQPDADTRIFPYSHSCYTDAFRSHTKKAGVKPIRLHGLRHSHASLLIELGFSVLLISERLGHENVSTTLNIYAHLFPSKQSEVAEKLDLLQTK